MTKRRMDEIYTPQELARLNKRRDLSAQIGFYMFLGATTATIALAVGTAISIIRLAWVTL